MLSEGLYSIGKGPPITKDRKRIQEQQQPVKGSHVTEKREELE